VDSLRSGFDQHKIAGAISRNEEQRQQLNCALKPHCEIQAPATQRCRGSNQRSTMEIKGGVAGTHGSLQRPRKPF